MKKQYDIEEQSQWLESIEVDKFDATSIMLASKLAMEIRKRSGTIISLSDKNVVRELGKSVIALDARDLNLIYRSLLDSVSNDKEPSELKTYRNTGSKPKKRRLLRVLSR